MITYLLVTVLPNLHTLMAIMASVVAAILLFLGLAYLDNEDDSESIKKLFIRGSFLLFITTTVLVLTPTREDLYLVKSLQPRVVSHGQ